MSGLRARSRSRPSGPRAGGSPGPNGGASRDVIASGYGLNVAHGPPQASAAAVAPQELTSTIVASGWASAIARARSGASNSARAESTRSARLIAPRGVRAR